MTPTVPALTVIILTFNEEKNLPACLDSLASLDASIFVVDSYSQDGTLALLAQRGIHFTQHPFENYARQRNWAQAHCPFPGNWVLHLDAGERLTPALAQWLNTQFDPLRPTAGYMFSRRTYFLGRWMRRGGHYPNYHLRLFRRTLGRCEDKAYDQHFLVDGPTVALPAGLDLIDIAADSVQQLVATHNRWALFEAIERVAQQQRTSEVEARLGGTPIQQRRWWKQNFFERMPLFWRSLAYFLYRYLLRGGFRDGRAGLVFHFLQGGWFRFLVDANIYELRQHLRAENTDLEAVVRQHYGEAYLVIIKPVLPPPTHTN